MYTFHIVIIQWTNIILDEYYIQTLILYYSCNGHALRHSFLNSNNVFVILLIIIIVFRNNIIVHNTHNHGNSPVTTIL